MRKTYFNAYILIYYGVFNKRFKCFESLRQLFISSYVRPNVPRRCDTNQQFNLKSMSNIK